MNGVLIHSWSVPEWIGIRAYEPQLKVNGDINWHLVRNTSDKLKNIMTIGIYEGHAFLIKDITKLAKTYVCNNCRGRFTKACHLQRHNKTCGKGETEIICPEEKLAAPLSKYEVAFYDKGEISRPAIEWLEKTAKWLKIHIHHAMCGHGGGRDMCLGRQLMVFTQLLAQFSSFTVVGGTAVRGVLATEGE